MYIIVAVLVIIIVVAGAAAYYLMNNNGNGGTNATPTPTPVPTVVGASTLQFSVADSSGVIYNYAIKGIAWNASAPNTANAAIRIDIPGGSAGNYTYIINAATMSASSTLDNGVTWTADTFATDWTQWSPMFNGYLTDLVGYDGHAVTFTANGNTFSAIHINPTLDDATYFTA
jgi:hypothetical protein